MLYLSEDFKGGLGASPLSTADFGGDRGDSSFLRADEIGVLSACSLSTTLFLRRRVPDSPTVAIVRGEEMPGVNCNRIHAIDRGITNLGWIQVCALES